ncbi:MAG: hypothetical protein Q8P92_04970 [Candidatus Daviesbacteria bacterium]|nr:hypothetical protein [Candidatus Daviesbacteria bacterium]
MNRNSERVQNKLDVVRRRSNSFVLAPAVNDSIKLPIETVLSKILYGQVESDRKEALLGFSS